jgi:1,4-dihydroxy-6-naphthoate synthase
MSQILSYGISPCPNDTYIHEAIVDGTVPLSFPFAVEYHDVETLNQRVLEGSIDIAKISCGVWPFVQNEYRLLASGGAMGYGTGPLLLSSANVIFDPAAVTFLPGEHTTAALLFRYWCRVNGHKNPKIDYALFDELYRKMKARKIEQAVVIHEHRFTWEADGLCKLADLGTVWEQNLKCPVPLGCVVVKRSLGEAVAQELESAMRASIQKANRRKKKVTPYIKEHAQTLDDSVIVAHIQTFVNKYSQNMGASGSKALRMVEKLLLENSGKTEKSKSKEVWNHFADVVVPSSKMGRLTYGLSDSDAQFVKPGSVVWVTLKGRKERCLALAMATHQNKPDFPVKRAWPHPSHYAFEERYLDSLQFAARYYLTSEGEALTAFWPAELEKYL